VRVDSDPFRLTEEAIAAGYRLLSYEEIGSTNDEAMRLARSGDPGYVWLIARSQTQGRGRRGRQWTSPPGNLHASLLLIDALPLRVSPQLGFVAGVALARALREIIGDDQRLRLKWPNDILYDGAKLAGILLESTILGDGRFAAIVGIGVNCVAAPDALPYPATALAKISAPQATAQAVFLHLSRELHRSLHVFAQGRGFTVIREEWLAHAAGLDAPIRVDVPAGSIVGRFRTIDEIGRLVVETEDGLRAIEAGDVWLAEPQALGANEARGRMGQGRR